MSIRVLLADDHVIFRQGLKALLKAHPAINVVAEAGDGVTAVELAAVHRPDVAVLDIAMPRLSGMDAIREIRAWVPHSAIVVLSARSDRLLVRQSLTAGARGYLTKGSEPEELARALDAVMRGEIFISEDIVRRLLIRSDAAASDPPLTPREQQMLRLLADGRATKEAAATMNVSVKTAETYRRSIMEKLHIGSVAELTKIALQEGLTRLDSSRPSPQPH